METNNLLNNKQTILIVDDEPQNIHLLGKILNDEYHILVATSAQQAFEKIASKPYPNMILLDIVMPEINGFEVCKRIKSNPETQDIPIIFITAKDSVQDEKEGLEIGAVDFISKPLSNSIVLARVKTHLAIQNQKIQIKHSEAMLKATLESTRDGIAVFDTDGNLLLLNQNFIDMWNIPEELIANANMNNLLEYGLTQLVNSESHSPRVKQLLNSDKKASELLQLKDGRIFSRYSEPLIQDNVMAGRVVSYNDISEQKKLESKLRELSLTDPLTGLYNRRKLNEILKDELNRALRYQHKMAVLMIDIDHFKKVNDTYGHDQGDLILQSIAFDMKKHFRNVDWCCRFGGEEFCVIMPDSDLPGTMDAAERFRHLIEEKNYDSLHVTISIGLSVISHLNEKYLPDEMLTQADKALYQAKANGRNQVQVFKLDTI